MITLTCDLCGREISNGQPYAVLEEKQREPQPKRWHPGWIGHYHDAKAGEPGDCYTQLNDLIELARDHAGFLRDIDVTSEPEINAADHRGDRRIARLANAIEAPRTTTTDTSLHKLGLPPRACLELGRCGIATLGEALALTDDELLAIDGVGIKTVDIIRSAATAH